MNSSRRIGAEDSATRTALLDAALALLVEEGYASVTSRRVAARAGLKPQLVHYYFRTMDDLFLALVRRGAEQNLERQARALASPRPLRALWELASDPAGSTLNLELSALANHRRAVRTELLAFAEQFRRVQVEALARLLDPEGTGRGATTPEAAAVLLTGASQILGIEAALGLTTGHAEARAAVEQLLTTIEGDTSGGRGPGGGPTPPAG